MQELGSGDLGFLALCLLQSLDECSRARDTCRALELNADTTFLTGSGLGSLVGGNAGEEINTALGGLDVLDADVHTLLLNAAIDDLVDNDADRRVGDVEHDTGTAVVEFVGHTFLDGRVDFDVDVVSDLMICFIFDFVVVGHRGSQSRHTAATTNKNVSKGCDCTLKVTFKVPIVSAWEIFHAPSSKSEHTLPSSPRRVK